MGPKGLLRDSLSGLGPLMDSLPGSSRNPLGAQRDSIGRSDGTPLGVPGTRLLRVSLKDASRTFFGCS